MGPVHWDLGEERWAACVSRQSFISTDLSSDYWLTTHVSLPRKIGSVKPSIHICLIALVVWLYL